MLIKRILLFMITSLIMINQAIAAGFYIGDQWVQFPATSLTSEVTGVLPVSNGGTNASSASITALNNITGYSASGATGTTSTNIVFSTSPSLATPSISSPTISGTLSGMTTSISNLTTTQNIVSGGSVTATGNVSSNAITSLTSTGVTINASTAVPAITASTTSAGAGLAITGSASSTGRLRLQSTSGVGGTSDFIDFNVGNNGGTRAGRIVGTGNWGIGTAAPGSMLSVGTGGALTVDTNGNLSTTGTIAAPNSASTDHAVCWKSAGVLGYCSVVVDASGICGTCN